jgi:GDP-L-fucose synthase
MKKVLLLGSTGFIGRNVLPKLRKKYDVEAPARTELDLLDIGAVREYLQRTCFDAVIHLAIPTSHNAIDKESELAARSILAFMSVAHCSELYGRMIYLGSGAEYGKHRAISGITETEFGKELPRDVYGLSRYTIGQFARNCESIINLRLFACCGVGDHSFRLIPHVISCIKANKQITLRQNVKFDYLDVSDIIPVLEHFVESVPKHNAYNLCSGMPVLTGDVASEVRRQIGIELPIVFENGGFGLEYTGNNGRLRAELPNWKPRTITESIKEILENENRQVCNRKR